MLFSGWRCKDRSRRPVAGSSTGGLLGRGLEPLEDRWVPAIDPVGGAEFLVSQLSTAREWYSTSSIDNNGNMIFAYLRSATAASGDSELWFRILNPTGGPVVEAPLPILFQDNVQSVSVAAYRDREFALIWTANESPDPGNESDVVYVQRFTRNGVGIDTPVALARSTSANLSFLQPSIDSTPTGDLVMVWRERNDQDTRGDVLRYGRWASNLAAPIVQAQPAAEDVDPGPILDPPAIAVNGAGDFIIAWVDQETPDGAGPVRFRRFTATGVGAAIQTIDDFGFSVDVDIANDRSFVVVWDNEIANAVDQITFQRFNSNGVNLGGPQNIFPATLLATQPNIVVSPNGGPFSISFVNEDTDIALFQFNQDGTQINAQPFIVNVGQVGDQLFTDFVPGTTFRATRSQMAINDSGDYVITWWGQIGTDPFAVAARNFLGERTLGVEDAEVVEGDVNLPMTFTVTLDNPAPVPITVQVSTEQLAANDPRVGQGQVPAIGTPNPNADYISLNNVLVTVPAGQTTANFNVTIIGDTQIEEEEVFAVNLTRNPINPRPSVTLDPDSALGVIIDDDTPAVTVSNGVPNPTLEPAAPPIGNLTPMTFTVSISKTPVQGPIRLNYRTVNGTAVAGQDYVGTTGTLEFATNTTQLSQQVVVQIRGDGISEPVPPARTLDPNFVETFQLFVEPALTNANPVRLADPVGVGSIQDSQPAQMIFPTPRFETPEGDAPRTVSIPILLNKPATTAATVTVTTQDGPPPNGAVAGVDYTAILAPPPITTSNTITIAPGDTEFTIDVQILGNEIPERDRDFLVTLTVDPADVFLPGGIGVTTESFTVRILDDDGTEVYLIDVSDSMESVRAQDIDGNGELNDADDLNGDGQKGTLIDQAISQVSQSFANSLQRRGAIIIFGRDGSVLNMDPSGGFSAIAQKGAGVNDQGLDIFNQALRTVQLGSGGLYSQSNVDPSRTFYEYALPEIFNLGVSTDIIARATIVSDGSGLLAQNSPALAAVVASEVPVSAIVLGPYQNVGSTRDLNQIVAATGGSTQSVNDDLIPFSADAGGVPSLVQPSSSLVADPTLEALQVETPAATGTTTESTSVEGTAGEAIAAATENEVGGAPAGPIADDDSGSVVAEVAEEENSAPLDALSVALEEMI